VLDGQSKVSFAILTYQIKRKESHFIDYRTWIFSRPYTNGRAIATVLRPSSWLSSSSVTLCIVAKRCVLEQELLLRAYTKSYMRNRLVPNEWPWPFFTVLWQILDESI